MPSTASYLADGVAILGNDPRTDFILYYCHNAVSQANEGAVTRLLRR